MLADEDEVPETVRCERGEQIEQILLDYLAPDGDGAGVGQGEERVDVRHGRGDDDGVAVIREVFGAPMHDVLRDVKVSAQRCLRAVLLHGTAREGDDRTLPVEALHVQPGHLLEVVYTRGYREGSVPSMRWYHLRRRTRFSRHPPCASASLTSFPLRASSTPDHVSRGPGRKSAVRKSREYRGSEWG